MPAAAIAISNELNDGADTLTKYAICNELYSGWSDQDAMLHAYRLGYRGWEVAPFTLGQTADVISPQRRQQMRQAAESVGLEIVGLHWLLAQTTGLHLTDPDPAVRRSTADYFRHLIRLCHDLGGRLMVLGSPQQRNLTDGMSFDQGIELAAEVLKSVTHELEDAQVTIAVEPLGPEEGNFLLTADEAVELIHAVDSPMVRLHLDVKAMSTEPQSVADTIDRHADHLVHFHANDPNRQGPGMGKVDYTPIMQALKKSDYTGWVSVEVFDYRPGIEPIASQSIDYLRRIDRAINA